MVVAVAARTQANPTGIQVIVGIVLAVGIEVVDIAQVARNCQIVVVSSMAAGHRPYWVNLSTFLATDHILRVVRVGLASFVAATDIASNRMVIANTVDNSGHNTAIGIEATANSIMAVHLVRTDTIVAATGNLSDTIAG